MLFGIPRIPVIQAHQPADMSLDRAGEGAFVASREINITLLLPEIPPQPPLMNGTNLTLGITGIKRLILTAQPINCEAGTREADSPFTVLRVTSNAERQSPERPLSQFQSS